MQTNNGKQSHIHPCPAVLSLYLEQWTPPSLSFYPSLLLMREKRIFEKETEEKVSPSSRQKCTTNNFLAYTQTKKEHHVYFYRDGGESKRGVRNVHYTKVERAQSNRYYREKLLYIRVLVVKTSATPE